MDSLGKKELIDFSEYMLLIVSKVLGKKAQEFSLDSPISQFGLDSIGVTKIVFIVNKAFKLKISPVSLYGHKTVKEAASNLYHSFENIIDLEEITPQLIQSLCDKFLAADSEQKITVSESSRFNQTETVLKENNVNREHLLGNSLGLVSSLFDRVQQEPNFVAYTLLDAEANKVGQITNADLHKNSLLIAKAIQDHTPHSGRVLLIFDKNIHFIYALCGTLYSGSIAIPFTAPRHYEKSSHIDNLIEVIQDSGSDIILTTRNIFSQLSPILPNKILSHIKFIIYEDIDRNEHDDIGPKILKHNPLALIQYSTGLSNRSKGVLYSHADVLKHLKRIQASYHLGKESRSLSWAPVHHYMGLFYGILQPLYSGLSAYLCADANFKFQAQMWLSAI